MNSLWISALISGLITIVKRLLEPDVVSRILSVVASIDKTELSGEEKRTIVFDEAANMAKDAAPWLLNLVIEIAVARLRTAA